MFKCIDCGHIFEDGEQARWTEMHGFTYGNGEEFEGCPVCKGDYFEAVPCACCGEGHYFEGELENGVCNACIEKHFKDFEFCVKVGAPEDTNVPINGAIASLWTAEEINEILIGYARDLGVTFERFAYEDISWFAEMIKDEVKK